MVPFVLFPEAACRVTLTLPCRYLHVLHVIRTNCMEYMNIGVNELG